LIDNLNTVVAVLAKDGGRSTLSIDKLEQLITGLGRARPDRYRHHLAGQRHRPLASLLGEARQPLAGAVEQANRLAPLLYNSKDGLEAGSSGCRALPQAAVTWRLRQLHPVLHLRPVFPRQRPAGPDRGLPVGQARDRKVHRTLMLNTTDPIWSGPASWARS
jgi:hypothetical protein